MMYIKNPIYWASWGKQIRPGKSGFTVQLISGSLSIKYGVRCERFVLWMARVGRVEEIRG